LDTREPIIFGDNRVAPNRPFSVTSPQISLKLVGKFEVEFALGWFAWSLDCPGCPSLVSPLISMGGVVVGQMFTVL
jgi:hypothetical protein